MAICGRDYCGRSGTSTLWPALAIGVIVLHNLHSFHLVLPLSHFHLLGGRFLLCSCLLYTSDAADES